MSKQTFIEHIRKCNAQHQLPIPYEQEIVIEKVMAHVSKPELDRNRREVLAFLNQPRA